MEPVHFLFGGIVLSLLLQQLNQRYGSPGLAIVNRWVRWGVFAAGAARLLIELEWSTHPYWVLVLACFLTWFLLETLYNWVAIQALSVSPLPLFPRFTVNSSGEEWPTNPRLHGVRDWMRSAGFKQVQALRAEVGPSVYLRVSVYQDAGALVRLQVTFLPQANGSVTVCFSASSNTVSGYRYVTDNLYLPFAGFYPENWLLERNPWRRSLPRLLARHRSRVSRAQEILAPWTSDPLNDLNAQQRELEQINTELGFLFPQSQREEHGKITYEGRYRVWKEYWLLNYFGISARY